MQYFHEEMMKRLVEQRQESVASMVRESCQQTLMRTWIGLLLIRVGEKLNGGPSTRQPVMTLERRRTSRPGLT